MAAQPGQRAGGRECMHVVCIQAGAAREIVHAAKGAIARVPRPAVPRRLSPGL